ncbi:ribonuclease P protein component [Staphylococcus epidermidis]|uniref:ribonuclease P protein component n=1 Tax=Staphylococcus epidermidis TaxID=1282 RepID=UPI0024AE151D|nr:ribonuclease P protein component [Staphylococcus epidermidis]WHI81433.1 ribonuclease P protein component [Staphylococcus epidermidis]
MEKAYRIKRNSDFQAIYKNGKSVANRQFVVYTYKNRDLKHFRLGISVSKKLGNAVTRNRIKRAIRENFKVHKQNIIAKDIIVIARQPAKDMNTLEIQSSLEHVLKIAKVFNKKDQVGQGT